MLEGGDAWVTFGRMRYHEGGNWDVQQGPDETNYCVLVIYYPSLTRAMQWFDRWDLDMTKITRNYFHF